MDWFLLSIVSVIALSISNLLQRVLMRDGQSMALAYSAAFQLIGGIFLGAFTLMKGFSVPPIEGLWLQFALITVLYAAGSFFQFTALKSIDVSEVSIAVSSRALWTIAVALIFLGESFDLPKIAGVILVLSAVAIISFKEGVFKINKGVLYALGCGFCYGTAFAIGAYILRFSDVLSYTAISFLLPGLLVLAMRPKTLKEMKPLLKKSLLPKILLLGIFAPLSAVAIHFAYKMGGGAAQLASINQSVVVLTVILAALFLNERGHLWQKFAGAILATIGVALLK
ncbi:MAG: DMT family transporter [Parcubacteria group bacterium]|nr:DMT family transporter [Parcubacteria group bacterium]